MILEKFKHKIVLQEDSLANATVEIRNYNSRVKCQNALSLIDQQLDATKSPKCATDVEELIQRTNYLSEAFATCKFDLDELMQSDAASNSKDEKSKDDEIPFDSLVELSQKVDDKLSAIKTSLDDTIGCLKYIEEIRTLKSSIGRMIDSNLKDLKFSENIVETESDLRKLVHFQSEIRKRVNEIQPTLDLLNQASSTLKDSPIYDTLKDEIDMFKNFVDTSDLSISSTRKDLSVKIDFHKYISQSNLLVQNMQRISTLLNQLKGDKIHKHQRGYRLYFESLRSLMSFYETKYLNLQKIFKNLTENSSDIKSLESVKEQEEHLRQAYEEFVAQCQNIFKCLESVGQFSDFLKDVNYLKHSLDIKNKVGEWMLKCSDDDIAYYHKKASDDFEIMKEKVDNVKSEYEKLSGNSLFNNVVE